MLLTPTESTGFSPWKPARWRRPLPGNEPMMPPGPLMPEPLIPPNESSICLLGRCSRSNFTAK